MADTRFNCLPTMIGSLPHKDPKQACRLAAHYLRDIPAWPQLPLRSPVEGMVSQFSEGFPGIGLAEGRMRVDTTQDLSRGLEAIYAAYLEEKTGAFPVSYEYASGLHEFLKLDRLRPIAVKGQVTGPVSFGLSMLDASGKAILYDDTLSDAAAKLLRLKAAWQERELRRISPRTIMFVDEPGMASYGSAFFNLPREKVAALINDVLDGISGVKVVHCCGNTDWGLVISTSTDVVSFDAYNYAGSLALYPIDIKKLIERGGALAWGIVPNTIEALARESPASLRDRLEEAMAPFSRSGLPFARLKEQALLTPSCGLEGLTEDGAERALELLAGLSALMRGKAAP